MSAALDIVVDRPQLPDGYMRDDVEPRFLPWEYVEQRMTEAINYWIATTRPNGRPHVSPIWGIWHDGRFWFDGSPETRRGKNIAQNPHITINLEDGMKAVILEGVVTDLAAPSLELRTELSGIYKAKYSEHGYSPEPETWETGIYVTDIHTVLAWTEFGVDMTRWKLRRRAQ
jgi:hypothetical protein